MKRALKIFAVALAAAALFSCRGGEDKSAGYQIYISEKEDASSVSDMNPLLKSVILRDKGLRVDFRYVDGNDKPFSVAVYSWIPQESPYGNVIFSEFLGSGIVREGGFLSFYPTAGTSVSRDEFISYLKKGKGKIAWQSAPYYHIVDASNLYFSADDEAMGLYESFINDAEYGAIKVFVDNYGATAEIPQYYPVVPDAQHTVTRDGVGQITLGMKVSDIPASVSGLYIKYEHEQRLGSPVHSVYFLNGKGHMVLLARYRDGEDTISYIEAGRGCRYKTPAGWLGSGDDVRLIAGLEGSALVTGSPSMEHEEWYTYDGLMFYFEAGRIVGIGIPPKE